VPVSLAKAITEALRIPVIGIGAGPDTDAQIMVVHDMLGITPPSIRLPRFVKNFLPESTNGIQGAISAYVEAVKSGAFPAPEHCY
jgi:3-methyl-2-oxobutanoate hydroxymethyltransferase